MGEDGKNRRAEKKGERNDSLASERKNNKKISGIKTMGEIERR